MYLDGIKAENEFTAVQSTDSCAGPFTFSATVRAANNQPGNSLEIDFVSQDLTEALSVEANLAPSSPDYGIWAGDTLTPIGSDDVVATPLNNAT